VQTIKQKIEKMDLDLLHLQEEVVNFMEILIKNKAKAEKEKSEEAIDIAKLKGFFHGYADALKVELEKEAWKSHVVKRWRFLCRHKSRKLTLIYCLKKQ